ncbi:hypothetical protein [Actinocorallia aurantiaca]|uniref:Histidine kinase-like protein n=1 Tax=Actinocorallia aurantiaca TaxID=46204 RepID=A0ABN3UMD6_9ACTN
MFNGRGIGETVHPARTDQQGSSLSAERDFIAEPVEVRAGRVWLREVLPASCLVRDDCLMVLSELMGNAAEHGSGHLLRVRVEHDAGRVWGVLVEHDFPDETAVPRVELSALLEAGRLLSAPTIYRPKVAELRERGRGLLLVGDLCTAWEAERILGCLVIRWWLDGCRCEEGGPC